MFSIIVSIYKVEKYLRQCVESILNQTYRDFELILVDDGSPDLCPQICDEYAARDSRVRVIHKENGGLVSTRKVGVANARCEYICFVDGDDFVCDDMLQTYVNTLDKKDVDIICGGYTAYYEGRTSCVNQKIPVGFYENEELQDIRGKMLSVSPFFSFYIHPSLCIKCFRKSIVTEAYNNMPDGISLGEDAAVSYPAILEARSIAVIDYHGYMYRQNPESMTHIYDKNLFVKTRNLLSYLREVEKTKGWHSNGQIDSYGFFLLLLAKNNELIYNNTADGYFAKRRNLIKYIKDEQFRVSVSNAKISGTKNKLVRLFFKYKFIFPFYLWGKKDKR